MVETPKWKPDGEEIDSVPAHEQRRLLGMEKIDPETGAVEKPFKATLVPGNCIKKGATCSFIITKGEKAGHFHLYIERIAKEPGGTFVLIARRDSEQGGRRIYRFSSLERTAEVPDVQAGYGQMLWNLFSRADPRSWFGKK